MFPAAVTSPPHHRVNRLTGHTTFFNPWPSAYLPSFTDLLRGPWLARPLRELEDVVEDVRVVQPDWGRRELRQRRRDRAARASGASGADALEGDEEGNTEVICGTWVGHAGAFVEIPLRAPSSTSRSSPSTGASSTLKVLFDPIFSARASPVTWFGPKRMREAPCAVGDLPGVDIVAISHNHYDHLDLATILAVHAKWPRARYFVGLGNKPWFLARGIPARQVFEMDWWDEVTLPAYAFFNGSSARLSTSRWNAVLDEEICVTCVPAQHTSGRGLLDQRATLWCGWVIERFVRVDSTAGCAASPISSSDRSSLSSDSPHSPGTPVDPRARSSDPFDDSNAVDYAAWAQRPLWDGPVHETRRKADELQPKWERRGAVYHAGDTGYRPIASSPLTSPVFSALGRSHGPFDLSFIPIWRGGTLGFISALGLRLCQENLPTATHASPSDAVQIHLDARSRNTVGIHFGTFQGSHLEALEALHTLQTACDDAGVRDLGDTKEGKRGRLGKLDIGETLVVEVLAQKGEV